MGTEWNLRTFAKTIFMLGFGLLRFNVHENTAKATDRNFEYVCKTRTVVPSKPEWCKKSAVRKVPGSILDLCSRQLSNRGPW
jgi:hypothetical protein